MPSKSFKQSIAKPFRSSSSQAPKRPAVYDGRMSFSSDTSTLNVEFPGYETQKYLATPIVEDDMIAYEDRAWGPPPPMNLPNWTLPMFSRKKSSRS